MDAKWSPMCAWEQVYMDLFFPVSCYAQVSWSIGPENWSNTLIVKMQPGVITYRPAFINATGIKMNTITNVYSRVILIKVRCTAGRSQRIPDESTRHFSVCSLTHN